MHDFFGVSPENLVADLFKGFPPFLSGNITFNKLESPFELEISATVVVGHSANASSMNIVKARIPLEENQKNMWIANLNNSPTGEKLPHFSKRKRGGVGPAALRLLKNLKEMAYLRLKYIEFYPVGDGKRLWKRRCFKSCFLPNGDERILIDHDKETIPLKTRQYR